MRLKSLKLAGFKSFANPTTFTFAHDITAIVGPNGCGKSNVIDAIRWVLGETSAKQLRGGAMSDVIFAGVEGRAGKSLASVELTFEHTQDEHTGIRHALNLYHELTLRRQVSRDGKSDYFINGQRVRRRDVVDVFLGTGLGARSYAVIEQGMIGRIVESSPMELRAFIEEGAGVSRYQARRDATERQLSATRDNLERLGDLQSELKKQQKTLERQAESATRYQALQSELATIQKDELLKRIYDAYRQLNEKQAQKSSSGNKLTTLGAQVASAKSELDKLSTKLAESQWLKDDARDKYHNARMAEQTAEHNFYKLSHALSQSDERMATLIAIIDDATKNSAQYQADIAAATHKLGAVAPRLNELTAKKTALQTKLDKTQDDWQNARRELSGLYDTEQKLQTSAQLAQSQITRLHATQERLDKKSAELQAQMAAAPADDAQDVSELAKLARQIDSWQAQLDEVDIDEQKDAFDQHSAELSTLTQTVATLEKRHATLMGEYDVLHKMVHRPKSEPAQPAQNTSANAQLMRLPILQDNISLSTQGRQYAPVLDAFIGVWLDARLADEHDWQGLLGDVIAAAPDGDTPTLIYKTAKGLPKSAQQGLYALSELITAPNVSMLDSIYFYDTKTADGMALEMADGMLVLTDTGWLCGRFGVVHVSRFGQSGDFLRQDSAHRERLAELEEMLGTLEDELDDAQKHARAKSAELERLKIALEETRGRHTAVLNSLHQARQAHTTLSAQMAAAALRKENFNKQQHDLQEEKTQLRQELSALQSELNTVKSDLDKLSPTMSQAKKQVGILTSQVDEVSLALKSTTDALQALQLEHSSLQQARTHSEQLLNMAISAIAKAQADMQAMQGQDERMSEELPELERLHKQAKAHSEQLKVASEEHEAIVTALQHQLGLHQEALTMAHADFAAAQTDDATINADVAVSQSRLDDLGDEMSRLDADFNLPSLLHDFSRQTPTFSDHGQKLDDIKRQIDRLGAVNMAAAAELAELNERLNPMDAQILDIQQSMAKLEDAIKTIDEQTKTLFLDALDAVNAELGTLFTTVFSGGQASLSLIDDDELPKADKWRAGLVLMAQPKGKKNSRLAVLSGGEKTLTALSLIFAIFKQHPAPFCVLDEVDAPLDDANVGRFTSLISELASSVQFIFISHNKLAMQIAHELKGITMPTAGISSLVSVDLQEAEKYLEPAGG